MTAGFTDRSTFGNEIHESWQSPVLRKLRGGAVGAVITLIVFVLVAPPLIYLLVSSLHKTTIDGTLGAFTLANYVNVFAGKELLAASYHTAIFAVSSAVLAIVIGGSQAWIVERTDAPCKSLVLISTIVSLSMPFVLYVVAMLYALGKVGPVNDFLKWAFSSPTPLIDAHSMLGMVLIEAILSAPLAFLMLSPVIRAGNTAFEEAALTCGASMARTLRLITFKLALPGILAVLLLLVVRGVEAFEVPSLVGMPSKINVLTTDIFLNLKLQTPPDLGTASAFSVFLVGLVAIMLTFYHRMLRRAERFQTITGKGYQPRILNLGWRRWLLGAFLIVNFLICTVLPLAVLIWTSLLPYYQSFSVRALSRLTVKNFTSVLDINNDLGIVLNTLTVAAGTATLAVMLAAIAGWLIARGKAWSRVLDQLAMVPLVFPGLVLGVAMMEIYLALPLPIYGTIWILLIAFVIHCIPYSFRYATAGVVQIHRELEEAASVSGASVAGTLRRVVIPLIKPTLASSWLFLFLITTRGVSIPVLLASPGSQVVSARLYEEFVNGKAPQVAALGLIWTALMTSITIIFYRMGGRFGPVSR
jgi:iron(III) transport system permease protein